MHLFLSFWSSFFFLFFLPPSFSSLSLSLSPLCPASLSFAGTDLHASSALTCLLPGDRVRCLLVTPRGWKGDEGAERAEKTEKTEKEEGHKGEQKIERGPRRRATQVELVGMTDKGANLSFSLFLSSYCRHTLSLCSLAGLLSSSFFSFFHSLPLLFCSRFGARRGDLCPTFPLLLL